MGVVVISGANRGVGYGIAKAFFDSGFQVIALNRTQSNEAWMTEINCDVTKKAEIESAVDEIIQKYGRIDILVNNAGIRRFGNIMEISNEDWLESLNINLTAPLWLTQISSKWIAQSSGLVFFIGSHAGEHFFESGVAYSCTKAALRALSEVAIRDLRYNGIRFCYISLGATSNMHFPNDEWKITPYEVGLSLVNFSTLPKRLMPAYVDLRPSCPPKKPFSGIEELQFV